MNFPSKPLASHGQQKALAKKYHLSLKKTRVRESAKENDSAAANKQSNIFDYRYMELCQSDTSSNDSQSYKLRLSDSVSNRDNKKLPCYYQANDSKHAGRITGSIVLASDSNGSSSSNDNSPMKSGKKSRGISPYKHCLSAQKFDDPIDIIVLESSDSDTEEINDTNKKHMGVICLDSDDDSVLNTLKFNTNKFRNRDNSFDRLKKNEAPSRITDNRSWGSASSSRKEIYADHLTSEKGKGLPGSTSKSPFLIPRTRSSNSSSDSSSTHFSPEPNVPNNSSNNYRVISESSSSNESCDTVSLRNILTRDASQQSTKIHPGSSSNGKTSVQLDRLRQQMESNDNAQQAFNFANVTARSTTKPPGKCYDSVQLTKKDAQRILKGRTATANSHWQPKLKLNQSHLQYESESLSNYSQDKRGDTKNGVIINETISELVDSSSEDELTSKPTTDTKPSKTHVTAFINTPNQDVEQLDGLSDRKKHEISKWIMNNSPGSSSSLSIVSESNRNSSFGNSSLERFELKHETPNNRGKISKPGTSEKVNSTPGTLDRFVYKGKTSVVKNQSPLRILNLDKEKAYSPGGATPKDQQTLPRQETTKNETNRNLPIVTGIQNLHIEDCADVLDKLYGNIWRNKADAVLTPQTESRFKIKTTNKVKDNTGRKQNSRSVRRDQRLISNSEEDDFDYFTKNIRPNFNSTKKVPRECFINDSLTSDNSSESFYHTALTHPRVSKDNARPKPTKITHSTKRAICDSGSDVEGNYIPTSNKDLIKKQISFENYSSNSSTSEFDPGEIVPPKPKAKAKKATKKTDQQTLKPTQTVLPGDQKCSFLDSLSMTVPTHSCHPKARIYRENYKTKKEELCKELFKLYNKEIFDDKLPNDMTIEWNVRMRGTAGFCYNKKSVKALGGIVRSSRIVLATKILDTADRLRDTLVHELCHAAAWLINNVSDGHGPFWRGWASKAMNRFPEIPPIKRCHDYKIKTKFTYRCTVCGYSIGRHSKSLNIETKRCGHCLGKFELLINRTTRSGTAQVATPVQARGATGFALFVKENYQTVKKHHHSMKHAEIMKILGQQFSAVKINKNLDKDVRT